MDPMAISPVNVYLFCDVEPAALLLLFEILRKHGVEITTSTHGGVTVGLFTSIAGRGAFTYNGQDLSVTIAENNGHFSVLMIKGGLRQLVSEAKELSTPAKSRRLSAPPQALPMQGS